MAEGMKRIMRQDLDDIYRRNIAVDSYRARKFVGKGFLYDEYTGEWIFLSNYGLHKTAQTNHIVTLRRLAERYPHIPTAKLLIIDNSDDNLAITNGLLNQSKGACNNTQYIINEHSRKDP